VPTPTPTPAPLLLTVPHDFPLMAPPAGQPDEPLVGATALDLAPGFPADPAIVAGTTGSGVLISSTGGQSWSWGTSGLPLEGTVNALTFGPGEIAAIVDHSTAYRSRDGGATWGPMPGLESDVAQVAYSPAYAQDGVVFAVRGGALLRSSDRGSTWGTVLPANNCPINIALSPAYGTDHTALAPRCDQIVLSTDGGMSWQSVPREGPNLGVGDLSNLKTSPDYPSSGRLLAQGDIQGLPLLSRDGGHSWERAYDPQDAPFLLGNVGNAYFGPGTTFYATGRTSLYDSQVSIWLSPNEGTTWFAIGLVPGYEGPPLRLATDGALWAATTEGIFRYVGGSWHFVHPGGSRLQVIDLALQQGVALVNRPAGKYTTRVQIYEKPAAAWQLDFEETANMAPRRAFPAPDYPADRLLLVLAQDYGGQIWVVSLRPDAPEPFQVVDAIPPGPGDSLPHYQVTYADDYPESGRIELRHGYSGALYISTDRGFTWSRPDPAEPGACERNPVSGFGALWFGDAEVRNLLLCPLEDEQPFPGIVQPFEHGEMIRLESETSPPEITIYALLPDWETGPSWGTMPYYETDRPLPEPPGGFFPPDPLLKTAWLEGACCRPNTQPAQEALGWATTEATSTSFARQRFEGGTMIWRQDRDEILVLFSTPTEDRYQVFPD
jgi:hypothetical protein